MAIAPVVIEFLAKGVPQIQQAFQSIQTAAVKAARAQATEADKAAKAAKKATDERVANEIRAMKMVDRLQSQSYAKSARDAEARDKAKARSAERAEKERITKQKQLWAAEDKMKADALKKGEAEAKARIKREEQAEKKAQAERTRAEKQAAKERVAIQKQEARETAQFWKEAHATKKRLDREASEQAKRESKARVQLSRNLKHNISRAGQAERDLDAWQQSQNPGINPGPSVGGATKKALGRVVGAVVGAGAQGVMNGMQRVGSVSMGLASTAAQLGGGLSLATSVMGEHNLRKQAAQLSASTLLAGSHSREIGTDEILNKAKSVGIANNIDPEEVLNSFDRVKKLTGNLDQAMRVSGYVAKLSKASGADISDVSGLAANIVGANEHIKDEDLFKQLRLLTRQGVIGGVELEDFAKYGSRITAGATYFGGNKEENEGVLGAMAQMSRQKGGAASAAEATLGAQRFGSDLANHSDKLKESFGIDVRDGHGNIRGAESIILDILSKTNGDVTQLGSKITGLGERGVKPLLGAASIYKDAGGGQKGLDAVKKEFVKYTEGTKESEVDAAAARAVSEQGVDQEFLKLRIAVGEQLLPAFKDMIPTIRDLIPQLVAAAKIGIPAFTDVMKKVGELAKQFDWLIQDVAAHPVGAIIGFEITKSFASAGLPALLRGLFAGAFGGGSPVGVPGAPGGTATPGVGAPGPVGPGGSLAQGALFSGGVAALGAIAAEQYASIRSAQSAGEHAAEDVSKMDPDKAAAIIQKAKDGPGGVTGYATKIIEGIANVGTGGLGYALNKGTGAAINALGGKSTSDIAEEGIRNARMLDVLERIAQNTEQKPEDGSNSAARSQPIISR